MTPLCPPITGTTTELDSDKSPMISDTNVEARTTSRVVTPNSLGGTDVTDVQKGNSVLTSWGRKHRAS